MIVIILTYQAPLTQVDQHLAAHRDFLTQLYHDQQLVLSAARPIWPQTTLNRRCYVIAQPQLIAGRSANTARSILS